MQAVQSYLGSIAAASSTTNFTIAFPVMTENVEVLASALYAAVAGTTGLSIAVQKSGDNGTTWASAGVPNIVVPGTAATVTTGTGVVAGPESPVSTIAGPLTNLKFIVTNNDATNAATLSVVTQPNK